MTIESVLSFLGLVFMSRSFQLEKAAIIAPIGYIQLVVAFLYAIAYLKAEIHITEILGSLLIVGSIFAVAVLKACGVL